MYTDDFRSRTEVVVPCSKEAFAGYFKLESNWTPWGKLYGEEDHMNLRWLPCKAALCLPVSLAMSPGSANWPLKYSRDAGLSEKLLDVHLDHLLVI